MKKFIVIIFVLLCICGCQKEKSHEDLALEAIKARDRDACLLESDEAMKENGVDAKTLILKASCYSAPGENFTLQPVKDRDDAFALIQQALEMEPGNEEVKQKAEETWSLIDQFYSAIEGMGSCSLKQMQEKQEEFEVQEKDFALEEVPASKTGSNSRSENITMDNGNEWYYFTYLDDLGRQVWKTEAFWSSGHNYISEFYTYSYFDHDYFPCIRQDYIFTNDASFLEKTASGEIKNGMVQANIINMADYDENGKIVKEYAYVLEDGIKTYVDHFVDYAPFERERR